MPPTNAPDQRALFYEAEAWVARLPLDMAQTVCPTDMTVSTERLCIRLSARHKQDKDEQLVIRLRVSEALGCEPLVFGSEGIGWSVGMIDHDSRPIHPRTFTCDGWAYWQLDHKNWADLRRFKLVENLKS